jgi:hypothetical protein
MRQRLLSIGDDYWIEDEQGRRAFRVDGKALRVRQTFVLEDADGNEVAKSQDDYAVSCSLAHGFRRLREKRRPLTVAWPRIPHTKPSTSVSAGCSAASSQPRRVGSTLVANDSSLARIGLSDAARPACRMPGA